MNKEYDQSQTKNLPLDRGSEVLAAIKALEDEGFYQGSDDIELDFKVCTLHNQWEIKAGYTDTLLYVTAALGDQLWLADLEECEDDILPTNQQLLEFHPKILDAQLARIKQLKYERMMQAIAWVKELIEPPRQPSPETLLALTKNNFQCLGAIENYVETDTGWDYLETYEATIGDWHVNCLLRDDGWIVLDAIHKETNQLWQKKIPQDDSVLYEVFDSLKKIVRTT